MNKTEKVKEPDQSGEHDNFLDEPFQRRSFLKFAGAGIASAALVSAGCKTPMITASGINLGNGDFGILNMAYALEQMEAAFYSKVAANFYPGATAIEKEFLTDIRNNEIAHREWFKNVLGPKGIPALEFNFSSINFNNRESVLRTGKEIEDTGVSAYNGAGPLLKLSPFLMLAGKIVSVEARHVATIRNLLNYGDFAGSDVIDSNGLDRARMPLEVLELTGKFFKTRLIGNDLPTS
ncbi:MAG TPA: ferritin-like domain-containing protein [Sphingobacteriaceae bacterium]|nr:ferritin-like domain-containing protein [Sphingobacteriaceae bacterium]